MLQAGPAAKAGMLPGDVIVKVDGQAIRNVPEMMTAVAALPPGQAVDFDIQRGNDSLTPSIHPAQRPQPQRMRQR